MLRDELVVYLDAYLVVREITDYGPQGLQLESENASVERVALAVDVSLPVIEAATAWGADLLVVHHGILWRSVERLAGPLGARVRALVSGGLSLYAAHLPLDAHPVVGNNAVLASQLGIAVEERWAEVMGTHLGVVGPLAPPQTLQAFVEKVDAVLATQSRVLAHGPNSVSRVAILSGFGADRVGEAYALGVDTYLTGETSHAHFWSAADHGLNVIFAGHYATETVGVKALGRHMAERFGLEARFFDFPTGM